MQTHKQGKFLLDSDSQWILESKEGLVPEPAGVSFISSAAVLQMKRLQELKSTFGELVRQHKTKQQI